MNPTEQEVLVDNRQLDYFVNIGAAGYQEIREDLILHVAESLESIHGLIRAGDTAALGRSAHSLKGDLECFGCVAMTAKLAQLEQPESAAPGTATLLHAELHDLWHQSLAAINAWEKSAPFA